MQARVEELLEDQALSAAVAAMEQASTTAVHKPAPTHVEQAALDDNPPTIAAVWPGLSRVRCHFSFITRAEPGGMLHAQ